jgi:methylated-DNA-protein-cysteine methyltransferase-like protein
MVEKIPKGKVATYGQIAALCGLPGQARFVGYALHNTPFGVEIPWHRVINAQGRISFPKESISHQKQKRLLKQEGVLFKDERVDLKIFGWKAKK